MAGQDMLVFLGLPADARLLDADLANLPEAEQRREPAISSATHNRLVAAGSFMTGATLLGGSALALYAAWRLLFQSGGVFDVVLLLIGLLLAGTHWGWVHVAEYAGLTLDEHEAKGVRERQREWLADLQPYPRLSVTTSVLDDASTSVRRVLHRPVATDRQTFTFAREIESERTYEAGTPAAEIADAVETMRREARLETDRQHELWEAAASAYDASLRSSHSADERLLAERAAAIALSEHINTSLREPPLVE
jgi:hypothetical protein